jgi:hypothetical protein
VNIGRCHENVCGMKYPTPLARPYEVNQYGGGGSRINQNCFCTFHFLCVCFHIQMIVRMYCISPFLLRYELGKTPYFLIVRWRVLPINELMHPLNRHLARRASWDGLQQKMHGQIQGKGKLLSMSSQNILHGIYV